MLKRSKKCWQLLASALVIGLILVWTDSLRGQNLANYAQRLKLLISSLEVVTVTTMRQNLTFITNSSIEIVQSNMSLPTAEEVFHRYASRSDVICPEAKRLGNSADGGWDVCLHSTYRLKQPCLVYSFGINNDWSFDDAIVSTFNCTVRAFDPSMAASDHRRGTNIWFYKTGISGSDRVDERGWTLRTLDSLLRAYNESQSMIDYLKVDVEYSEWSSLDAILNSTILARVKQFGLEIHTKEMNRQTPSTVDDLVYYSRLLRKLQAVGFYRWYWHFNTFGKFISKHSSRPLTCCYEYVFINVNMPYT